MTTKHELFSYKGYFGSAEISHEDHCLVGQLLYIDDLVMYEGESFDDLEQGFQRSVDDYIEFCAEVGKSPEKTYSGSFNVRIGSELHSKAARKASASGVSLNDYVREAVKCSVEGAAAIHNGAAPRAPEPFYIFDSPATASTTSPYHAEIMANIGSEELLREKVSATARLTLVKQTPERKVA